MADTSLRNVLANYTGIYNGSSLPHDALLAPQMIVVNPGLHPMFVGREVTDYAEDVNMLLAQMKYITQKQVQMSLVSTRFVFHDITAVIDAQMKGFKVDKVNQTMALRFNIAQTSYLSETLRIDGSRRWFRVLPAQRLTYYGLQRGLIHSAGDGLHYDGGYHNIVTQLDLFFMNPSAPSKFCRP